MRRTLTLLMILTLLMGVAGCSSPEANSGATDTDGGTAGADATNTGSADTPDSTDDGELDLSGVTLRVGAASANNAQAILEGAGLDDTPYTVEFYELQGGNLVLEALAADQLDLGTGSQIPPIFAHLGANEGNFKVIAIRKASTLNQELIVPDGSDITSVEELAGKTVGYVSSTTSHYFLAKMLEDAGLTWEDVDTVALSTSDGLTALLTGELDALASYGNAIRSGKENGATTLLSADHILSGDYYWYATPAAIEDPVTAAAIADYLERFHEGNQWARENPEEWAAFYAPQINQSVEDYLVEFYEENAQTYTTVAPVDDATIASTQDIIDIFSRIGLLDEAYDASALFRRDFVDVVSGFTPY